jgi:hypothetical protein
MNNILRDKLEWVVLAMVVVLLAAAIYRFVLIQWRSNVDLRQYPFLRPLASRNLIGSVQLEIEMPDSYQVTLSLLDQSEHLVETIHDGELDAGLHSFTLDSDAHQAGSYFLQLTSKGQVDLKRIEIAAA